MPSVKLYGYSTSPFVRKTGCFLYYKGIDFTHVPVDPTNPEATIGHTNGRQVPVLEIDGEWKRESSLHAHWLDQVFPEKPLCPAEHREKILAIDEWINNTFLTSIFRGAIDARMSLQFRYRGWRLSSIVSAQTPLPDKIRHAWPDLLKTAPFIQDMKKHMDLSESHKDMQMRIFMELVAHLGEGPYLGGFDKPTMLDFAVFPQLIFGYLFGLEERLSAAMHPDVKLWMKRVSAHLPENPTLAPDFMQINRLESAIF